MLSLKFLLIFLTVVAVSQGLLETLYCKGEHFYNATVTAYHPRYLPNQDGFIDMRGKKLRTLQDYIDGRARYVTVSVDPALRIPYGTKLCVPELNERFNRRINFEIRDASDDVWRKGLSKIEICVRKKDDYDDVNAFDKVTLVFI